MRASNYVRLNEIKRRMDELESEMKRIKNEVGVSNKYDKFKLYEEHYEYASEYLELKKEYEHLKFICALW